MAETVYKAKLNYFRFEINFGILIHNFSKDQI